MCGIAGVLLGSRSSRTVEDAALERMRDQLRHRGPDGEAIWTPSTRKVGLVHTRLSVVDLSDTGVQPMVSDNGRYHLIFNGEIYNYVELRQQLIAEGCSFRGTSDTEVLLKLFERDGMGCLDQLDGMFAFAVYDELNHELWLARDPLGEKPLYLYQNQGVFAFASEVRTLVAGGLASAEPDIQGIAYLLRQGSIPPPRTHLRDVEFLSQATWCHIGSDARCTKRVRYWSIPFTPEADALKDRNVAIERVREVLRTSASLRGRADVPVGAFLSGGVDSTAVCVALIDAGFSDVQTFTVSLPGHPHDEATQAKTIARHLGLSHREIPLNSAVGGEWLERALGDMDVPSIDGVNTWLVSKAVHDAGMKVACSGLGGDELFHGYPSFVDVPSWRRKVAWLSPFLQSLSRGASLFSRIPPIPPWSRLLDALVAGGSLAALWFARRGLLSAGEVRNLLTDAAHTELDVLAPIHRLEGLGCPSDIAPERQISFFELSVYMHDQLLRDTDSMSMAHGLEVRTPLIGRLLVELVATFSADTQRPLIHKGLLRAAIAHRLPEDLLNARKLGFSLDWGRLADSRKSLTASDLDFVDQAAVTRLAAAPPRQSYVVPRHLVLRSLSFAVDAARRLESGS